MNPLTNTPLVAYLVAILIIAGLNDLKRRKIPNLLTYPTMALGFFFHTLSNGTSGLLFSAVGLFTGIGLLIFPYLMGGMGAGDAKLLGAVGAVLGPKGVFLSFLFTAIAGGIYAVILLLRDPQYVRSFFMRHGFKTGTSAPTGQSVPAPAGRNENKPKLCYGIAIAAGTLFYLISEWTGYRPVSW
jgi:prepilin peptidase CpaA